MFSNKIFMQVLVDTYIESFAYKRCKYVLFTGSNRKVLWLNLLCNHSKGRFSCKNLCQLLYNDIIQQVQVLHNTILQHHHHYHYTTDHTSFEVDSAQTKFRQELSPECLGILNTPRIHYHTRCDIGLSHCITRVVPLAAVA